MLIGHYATAFAAKRWAPAVPLALLFVAAQLVDILWALFVLAGIEKLHVVPGFTATNPLDLYFMPYTHSLVATLIWALLAALIYRGSKRGNLPWRAAVVFGLVVASHWFLDLLVHKPDLLLGFDGPRVGLGLWDFPYVTLALELSLLWLGIGLSLPAAGLHARRYVTLGLAMSALQISSLVIPPPAQDYGIALSVLGMYAGLTWLAWRTERS